MSVLYSEWEKGERNIVTTLDYLYCPYGETSFTRTETFFIRYRCQLAACEQAHCDRRRSWSFGIADKSNTIGIQCCWDCHWSLINRSLARVGDPFDLVTNIVVFVCAV